MVFIEVDGTNAPRLRPVQVLNCKHDRMRSYGQYWPISRAAEILGDRWTINLVRDLLSG